MLESQLTPYKPELNLHKTKISDRLENSSTESDDRVSFLKYVKPEDLSADNNEAAVYQPLDQRSPRAKPRSRTKVNECRFAFQPQMKAGCASGQTKARQTQDTHSAPSVFIKQELTPLAEREHDSATLSSTRYSKQNRYHCTYPGCGRTFRRKDHAKEHVLGHTGEKPFGCRQPGCLSAFINKPQRDEHERVHIPQNRRERFPCPLQNCDRTFMTKRSIRGHVKSHKGERHHVCRHPGCGAAFVHASHKTRHERTHQPDEIRKRFKCPHPGCGQACLSAVDLDGHLNAHSGIKPYVCDMPGCAGAYANLKSLCCHKKRFHPFPVKSDSPIPCELPDCDATFTERKYLTDHMLREHKIERYQCDIPGCTFRYTHVKSRVLHYQRDHNMSGPEGAIKFEVVRPDTQFSADS